MSHVWTQLYTYCYIIIILILKITLLLPLIYIHVISKTSISTTNISIAAVVVAVAVQQCVFLSSLSFSSQSVKADGNTVDGCPPGARVCSEDSAF